MRKQYETPRKQWDKQLLAREGKLVEFYGLKNKHELRKLETWMKYKRQAAKGLLALPLEKRQQRQEELMSGLRKIGLVKTEATLDDVLGLTVEAILEKRLQTMVLRKGLANTSKQARQFVVHGHIAINGRKVDTPGYVVPVSEVSGISWYKRPIKIETEAPKKDLRREFEESAGKPEGNAEAQVIEEKTQGKETAGGLSG